MITLPQKIVAIHNALAAGGLPHAFGGALALAWCTGRARGTIDIDVNVFLSPDRVDDVFAALPAPVTTTADAEHSLRTIGQARLFWERTPVDVFLNTTEFHELAARRCRYEDFAGAADVPFLACDDLAVFKAFFNRPQDWVDLAAMAEAETLDLHRVVGVIADYLGANDERIPRLLALRPQPQA